MPKILKIGSGLSKICWKNRRLFFPDTVHWFIESAAWYIFGTTRSYVRLDRRTNRNLIQIGVYQKSY